MPDLSIPFRQRKAKILAELSRPDAEYSDLSPKGSVDEEIRGLIEEINARDGLVTTSSCAGRVSVFLEGSKVAGPLRDGPTETGSGDGEGARVSKAAGAGGKGGGGRWLFVSHEQLCEGEGEWKSMFGLEGAGLQHEGPEDDVSGHRGETRLIHFKFEPMILHILAASLDHAQYVLQAALSAGFRESGAVTLTARPQQSAMPMVAVRSIGLAFESLLGLEVAGQRRTLVSDEYLRVLVYIANERFTENVKRIERFRSALQAASEEGKGTESGTQRPQWEDSASRRERLRSEGLERQKQKQKEKQLAGQRQPAVCAPIEDLRYSIPDV